MDQTCQANSSALGASGHNGICLCGPTTGSRPECPRERLFQGTASPMLCHLIIVFVLPLIGGAGELGTFEYQHAHCLSVNRGDVLDAAAAAPLQLCGTGMAQVSVRGVGGRGSERLRAEASRLRRPTRGRVVLRAASSFLPAFSESLAPILFGHSLQVCQASRREWSRTWDRAE